MWLKGKQQSCFGWMMTHLHTGWEILYVRNERARLRAKTINDRFYFSSSAQTGWKQLSYRWIMSDDGGSEVSVTQRAHVHTHACTHTHTLKCLSHTAPTVTEVKKQLAGTHPRKCLCFQTDTAPPPPQLHTYSTQSHIHTCTVSKQNRNTIAKIPKAPNKSICFKERLLPINSRLWLNTSVRSFAKGLRNLSFLSFHITGVCSSCLLFLGLESLRNVK